MRVDNENEVDAFEPSTGACRRGSDGPTGQHDGQQQAAERLHMAMTADGDSQDEAMAGLARARAARVLERRLEAT